jgi:hypothetical protein
MYNFPYNLPWIVLQWIVVVFVGFVGLIVLWKMWSDKIQLNTLLSEPDGKASLSRFQLLMFTFVVVSIYVVMCLQQGELQEISSGVLGLMGISGTAYVVSKGIQTQVDKNKAAEAPEPAEAPKPARSRGQATTPRPSGGGV